jgi:hypothetical protein
VAFSEKAVDADAYDAADAPEPCGRDAIDAVFIFLDLLELDAKRFAKLHLCEPLKLPPPPNGAPNGYVVFGRLSVHATLRTVPLELPLGLPAAMRVSMPCSCRLSRHNLLYLAVSFMPAPSMALCGAHAIIDSSQIF